MSDFYDILREKTDFSNEIISKLEEFNDILYKKNEVLNLTRVKREDSVYRNFLDSLNSIALGDIKAAKSVIDIGSGSGFPAIALAIAFPYISFTLVEATGKKADFLKEAAEALHLHNTDIICARAEELAHNTKYREKYDVVTARAVSRLSILCELSAGFVKVCGKVLFYKGQNVYEEKEQAQKSIERMNLTDCVITEYNISGENDNLYMVSFKKHEALSQKYPRMYTKIVSDYKK